MKTLISMLLIVLVSMPVWAQSTAHCDLAIGCHWELIAGTQGTYTGYVFKLGPDSATMQDFAFVLAAPKTIVQHSQVGIERKVSGLVVKHDTQISLYDNDGNLLSTQSLRDVTEGIPISQLFVYQICAQSPTEPDICTPEGTLTAL